MQVLCQNKKHAKKAVLWRLLAFEQVVVAILLAHFSGRGLATRKKFPLQPLTFATIFIDLIYLFRKTITAGNIRHICRAAV